MEACETKRKLSSASTQNGDQKHAIKRLKSVEDKNDGAVHEAVDHVDIKHGTGNALEVPDILKSQASSESMKSECSSCNVSMRSQTSKSDLSDVEIDTPGIDQMSFPSTVDMDTQHLSDPDVFPGTVDMASQALEETDMFDEEECFKDECSNSQRCQLLRKISDAIMGYDDVDGPSSIDVETDGAKVGDIVSYLQQQVHSSTQTDIAQYLSSGSLEYVKLSMDNIHHFFHVAISLRLKQLTDHCLNFCFLHNQTEILERFEDCECQNEIKQESKHGYQRSQSILSNPDDNSPPQYYIIFSDKSAKGTDKPKEKRAVTVMVIDMSEKLNVFDKEVEKLRSFGEGFACCSLEIDESPYVFVSGGVGKGSQMLKYDVLLGRWEKCAKMIHGRSQHMMLAVGENTVFSLSGLEVPCIEEYNIKHNKWHDRVSLITHVVSAATIHYNGKIYIFGGKTPAGAVNVVQCYDVSNHTIERLADLPCVFEGGKCVELKGRIYIATDQGHMICFNPENGSSCLCSRQPVQRHQFGMFSKNDRIYLVGGVICNEDTSRSVTPQYRYNTTKDTWVEKYKLCHSFPVLASCIVSYPKKCAIIPFNESF